jgi:phage FluMu protein Com
VPKPVPERETKDARGYQIEQLKRRYSPKETDLGHGEVSLLFHLAPSDPDFPFDLDHLECDLRVPEGYPKKPPQLHIKNKDIPRGFAINIEKGWDALVQEKRGATLLALTKALDRRLESLLSERKAETVKLTIFKDTRHLDAEPASKPASAPASQPAQTVTKPPVARPYIPEESYSKDQIAEAKARRAEDVRRFEARMRYSPGYQKSSDGIIYTLSLEPNDRASLPPGLQPVQSVQFIIPLLYPLQPLRILLNDVESEDAEPVEELFAQKAAEKKQWPLTTHLSYLAQNIDSLAREAQKVRTEAAPVVEAPVSAIQEAEEAAHTSSVATGKGHVYVIPRPVEWADDGTGSSESEDDSYDEDDEDGGAVIEAESAGPSLPTQTAERGIALTFPSIELYGIELLQVSLLNLSIKCDRCKTINEITGLKDNLEKASSCKKCATLFTVRFRQELIHQHSTRAGFIDATGCTVADLLPR